MKDKKGTDIQGGVRLKKKERKKGIKIDSLLQESY